MKKREQKQDFDDVDGVDEEDHRHDESEYIMVRGGRWLILMKVKLSMDECL